METDSPHKLPSLSAVLHDPSGSYSPSITPPSPSQAQTDRGIQRPIK